ncbi:hypothetical protein PAPYR_1942 [Paratrimastix pyriformis]|uniref:Peptidase S74 domain-containing protein n=1 Tax=Paratrimastix pyriformis TaxID=342808 RepID=A0ABQ8UTQ5_9EUKA|nr:hypothetical protein PAPYR_1942 [Paratrimastix pyriformis]
MPCAAAAISIDNRATSIQFVGSLAMLHVVPFMWVILQNATSVVASTYPIRPPSAPTREKLVLTMNDLSDSMFSINGGIGRIFRPDATRALVINSIASESYTTMSSALKLTYGGYTTGFVSRAADGVLSMTTGSSTATNSSIVLRDATGASAFTTLSTNGAATIGGILTVPSVASAGNLKLLLSGTSTAGTGLIVEDNSGAVNFAVNTSGASYSRGNHILGGTLTVGGTTSASLLGTDSTGLVVARTASINSVINTYALRAGDGSSKLGMYYSAVGATALNTNIYAPGCSPIVDKRNIWNDSSAAVRSERAHGQHVRERDSPSTVQLRLGNSPSATIASANKLNLESDYDQVVIGGDATSVLYNADVSNFGLVLRADGADAFRISKSRIVSPVIPATNLGSSGDAVDVRIDSDGRLGMAPSAAKYKTDIVDMQDTSAIYQLHPVNFHYKADANRTKCYGLIADEAFTVCPDLVRMKDGEVEGLYEHKLPFMMLNELQKLHTTVTEQRVTIASLQAQVDDLRSGMAALLELVSIFPSRNGCTSTSNLCSSQSTPSRSSGAFRCCDGDGTSERATPPTLAVDPAGVPNPPVEPTDEIVEIEFADKVKRNIKASWQRQVPLLASCKIMRSSLNEDVDTKRELGEMVEELRCYGMALSEGQLQSVSDGSGFTRQINKVRDYINSHETACFNRSYRNATSRSFAAQWDKYVAVLGAKLQCEKMESLKFTLLRDTVVSKDIYSLLDLNLKYRNVVYEFFDWFDAFVIRGDREGLVRRTVDVALNIDMSVLNGASDVMSIVNNILTSFKGANINKETIIAKLASIAQVVSTRSSTEYAACANSGEAEEAFRETGYKEGLDEFGGSWPILFLHRLAWSGGRQIASRNNFRKFVISYAKAEAREFRKKPETYHMTEAEKAAVKRTYQGSKGCGDCPFRRPHTLEPGNP